jgi:hypothetical protein
MKFRFLTCAMLATAFCATPAWAAWNGFANRQEAVPDKTTTPKPSSYNITLTILESSSSTTSACTGGTGFADFCPSGLCDCFTYTGTASGTAGKGPVTFYETLDFGDGDGAYESGCTPAYGEIDITGSKDTEAIAFTGADCGSSYTPQGFLNGGCFLLDTNVFTVGGAIATCGGNYSQSMNTKFTIKGKALK